LLIWFCKQELCSLYGLSLFMVRGHKDPSLWPKASPLTNLFGFFASLFCCYRLVCIWNPFDYVHKNTLVVIIQFSCNFLVQKCTNLGCNDLCYWQFLLEFFKYLSWGNVETPCISFPRPSLLRLWNDRLWSQNIIIEVVYNSISCFCDGPRLASRQLKLVDLVCKEQLPYNRSFGSICQYWKKNAYFHLVV